MIIEVRTKNSFICNISIKKKMKMKIKMKMKMKMKSGKTVYSVECEFPGKMMLYTEVKHQKEDGALALAEEVLYKLNVEFDLFFSIPFYKVVKGMLKYSDIPKRYREVLVRCLGPNGSDRIEVSKIEDWIKFMKNGICQAI
jgi:hypothetical protein